MKTDALILKDKIWKILNSATIRESGNEETAKECTDVAIQYAIDVLREVHSPGSIAKKIGQLELLLKQP